MPDRHSGCVLIVEDDAELRFILTAHLRAAGFDVIEASDGAVGVKTAAERQPDIIIMDIGLPVLDGITAIRTLKADERTAQIPVIILTARSGTRDVVRGLEAGAQEYLPKPFDVAELLARVQSVHKLAIARRDLDLLNSELEEEVDEKTRTLRVLYEFMRDLNRADSRDRILDLVIGCVKQASLAHRISLFLTDSSGEFLVCERAIGIDRSCVQPISMDKVTGITEQVFRSGTTLAAKTHGDPVGAVRGYRREAFLSTPLISTSVAAGEGVIGVLNVTDKDDDGPFTDEEIGCIRSIADASAIALDRMIRRTRLQQSVRVLLETVGRLAEYRDEETSLHIERVSVMAKTLAKELQRDGEYAGLITDDWIEMLGQAAPMHDIGKVGIPDDILTKPGRLTDEEFQIMKTHTDIGRRVLSRALDPAWPNPLLQMCVEIAHCHHERFDGAGYPRRMTGQDIPLAARVVALVDAYDAITSRRRYKEARTHEEAVDIVRVEAGKHFDPVLSEAFLRCHALFDDVREKYEENTVPAKSGIR